MANAQQPPAAPAVWTNFLVPTQMPQPIMIGTVVMHINPQMVQETLPRQVVYVQTMQGAVRTDFGNGVRSWNIQGHTGQGGLGSLLALKALEAAPGKPQAVLPFIYPWKYGSQTFQVYMDDTTWEEHTSGEDTFLFYFTILLREASAISSQPPIILTGGILGGGAQ